MYFKMPMGICIGKKIFSNVTTGGRCVPLSLPIGMEESERGEAMNNLICPVDGLLHETKLREATFHEGISIC